MALQGLEHREVLLPACASEQGNVIGSVRIYVCTKKNCN